MFAQRPLDRRRFVGTVAVSTAAAWIGTRDSVLQLITVEPFRLSGAKDLASLGRATAWLNSLRKPMTGASVCFVRPKTSHERNVRFGRLVERL